MDYTIRDVPVKFIYAGKYSEIQRQLLALPPGKALVVPLNSFGTNPPNACLQTLRNMGRKCHSRKTPDGIYLWLEPLPNGSGSEVA